MEQGELVPDELVIRMILEEIEDKGARRLPARRLPAHDAQADALADGARGARPPADRGAAHRGRRRRSSCSGCRAAAQCTNGHLYHVETNPPENDGRLRRLRRRGLQRDDDRPEVIRQRLETYHEKTEPLIDYYEERGLLRRFDGTRAPTEVHDHIRATLATLRLEERL